MFSCSSSNCGDQELEIIRLKKELSKKNNLYLDLDKTMLAADKSLSSIKTEQKEIDSLLKAPNALSNKNLILEKIKAMQKYAQESREKITQLETKLSQSNSQVQESQGLRMLIAQLKNELDAKDKTIAVLNEKVQDLENNLVAVQAEVIKKDNIIKDKNKTIKISEAEKSEAERTSKEEENKRRAAEIKSEIIALIKDGETSEATADGYAKHRHQKRDPHLKNAYDKYKRALELYLANSHYATLLNYSKSEIETKMRDAKNKASKKAQEEMR